MNQIYSNIIRCICIIAMMEIPMSRVSAQLMLDSHEFENQLYESHVKSLDEFIQRLNGKEINSFASQDSDNKIRTTRFSLFDYELLKNIDRNDTIPSIYEKFVNEVEVDSIIISIENPQNWVEAKCDFSWKNTPKSLSLKMQLEEDENHCWRWCVIGVDGLEESRMLDNDGKLQISPVEHELNFIGVESLFSYDYENFVGTRRTDKSIDQLSYFYGLVYSGLLNYKGCESVEFHCEQIPGYSFIVKEIHRLKSSNSGWLIVSLKTKDKI